MNVFYQQFRPILQEVFMAVYEALKLLYSHLRKLF